MCCREDVREDFLTAARQEFLRRFHPKLMGFLWRSRRVLLEECGSFDIEDACDQLNLFRIDGAGMGGNRELAPPVECREDPSLCQDARRCLRVVHSVKKRPNPTVSHAALKTQGALSDGRKGEFDREIFPNSVRESKTFESGGRQNDGIDLIFVKLPKAGPHISPQRFESEIRSAFLKLCHSPEG